MGKLIYSMIVSVDGYVESAQGGLEWTVPGEEMNAYINESVSSVGTFLYGRRMYDAMVFWETADAVPGLPGFLREWTRLWLAAEKIVYSRTLAAPRSARTRMEREFDPEAVRRMKAESSMDLTVSGPELAAHALRAGLVDELQMIVFPVVLGAGKRFFPDDVRLDLQLLDERRFGNGATVLRYAVRQ